MQGVKRAPGAAPAGRARPYARCAHTRVPAREALAPILAADPVEELLHALRHAFPRDREALPALGLLLAALALLVVALRVAAAVRARRAMAVRLTQMADHRGLTGSDLALVARLARRAETSPLDLLTRLDLFERATAGVDDRAGEVRRLRRALGFDRLPPHAPLLTTRELPPGAALALRGRDWTGQVTDVDEGSFAVKLRPGLGAVKEGPAALEAPPGEVLELDLEHAHDARYRLRCLLVGARPGAGGAVLLRLGHDEAPLRMQRRAFARVAARGPMELRRLAALVPHSGSPAAWSLSLVDVSGGGALVESAEPLPVGLLGRVAFEVGEARFEGLRAVVLASAPATPTAPAPDAASGGEAPVWRSHLELVRVADAERDRLVAAVTRLAGQQVAAARDELASP